MEVSVSVFSNNDINSLNIVVDPNGDYNNFIKSEAFGASRSTKCLTCKESYNTCYGHWGRIALPSPIVRPAFVTMLNSIISKLCLHCGLKIPISTIEDEILSSNYILSSVRTTKYRTLLRSLQKTYSSISSGKCRCCGSPAHKFRLISDGTFSNGTYTIDHESILRLVKSIPFHLYPIFTKYTVPLEELFFTESYPIIPIYLRHSLDYYKKDIVVETNLTKKYIDLVSKISSRNTAMIQRCIDELEYNDSIIPGSSLSQPFIGKYNMFRKLINSYSGDYTTRTVLNVNQSSSPDVGYFCKEAYSVMNSRIYLNSYTANLISSLLEQKVITYVCASGRYIKVKTNLKKPIVLEPGDYVELNAEDMIKIKFYPNMISYRQPSLHQGSIVGNIIKYMSYTHTGGNTNTLSTTVLPGNNGDQDGDEFNCRLLSDTLSRYEHEFLIRPRANMITNSVGSLAYGLIQIEILTFIKHLVLYGRDFYKDLLPYRLRDASFDVITPDEIMTARKPNNLIKNISLLSSKRDGFAFFIGIVKRVKSFLGREKLCFMLKEIYESRDFHISMRGQMVEDINKLQNDILRLDNNVTANYITKTLNSMTKKYESSYKTWVNTLDLTTNDYALISFANLKVNPKMLQETLVIQKSERVLDLSEHYLNRPFPIFPSNSLDINAYGVITNSYFFGLKFVDLLHTIYSGRLKVLITAFGTAVPGRVSRDLAKTMEDIVINSHRFAVQYNLIIDPCYNCYKLPLSELYLIPINLDKINSDLDLLQSIPSSTRILTKNSLTNFISSDYKKKIETILFPLDLPFILKNLHTLVATVNNEGKLSKNSLGVKEKLTMISNFSEHVHIDYMFSFGAVNQLLYLILSHYLLPVETLSTNELLYIFSLIDNKYKKSLSVGDPCGIMTALTIGEMITQTVISNFHSVRKGGEDIDIGSESSNVDKINLRSDIEDGIAMITSLSPSASRRLYRMKLYLEYCNLETLGYRIISNNVIQTGVDGSNNNDNNIIRYKIVFSLDRTICDQYNLSSSYIEDIIIMNTNTLSFITRGEVMSYSKGRHIITELIVDIPIAYKPIILLSLRFFSKGSHDNIFNIRDATLIKNPYYPEYLKTKELIMTRSDLKILSMFDTQEMNIQIPVENTFTSFGPINTYNMLLNTYSASPMQLLHYRSLALFQCRYSKPMRIRKFNSSEQPVLSKMSHQSTYLDMQLAALLRDKQRDTISGSILLSQPVRLGTGYYDISMDLSMYYKAKSKKKSYDDKVELII